MGSSGSPLNSPGPEASKLVQHGGPLRRLKRPHKELNYFIFHDIGLLKHTKNVFQKGSKITVSLPHLSAFSSILDVAPG